MKLSVTKINSLKPSKSIAKYSDGKGLIILVHPNGSKYWRLNYRYNYKQKTLALGVYPYVSLAQARERAFQAKCLIADGTDPSEVKKQEKLKIKGTTSFRNIAQDWYEKKQNKWSERHAKDVWKSLEKDIFKFIGDKPIDSISPTEVLNVLKRIEKRGALEQLSKIKQRCSNIFLFAKAKELIHNNPVDGLEILLKEHKSKNFTHITAEELPELVKSIDSLQADPTTKTGLIVALHTFLRTSEIRFLTWDCIDFENSLLTVPKELMKMKREHIVPMSKTVYNALQNLQKITGIHKYVFASIKKPETQPFSENAMLYALYRLGWKGRTSVHGFRHLASTTLRELGFQRHVVEKQLSHEVKNKVEAS
jgi:integrase